jgi:hypothetical protein
MVFISFVGKVKKDVRFLFQTLTIEAGSAVCAMTTTGISTALHTMYDQSAKSRSRWNLLQNRGCSARPEIESPDQSDPDLAAVLNVIAFFRIAGFEPTTGKLIQMTRLS